MMIERSKWRDFAAFAARAGVIAAILIWTPFAARAEQVGPDEWAALSPSIHEVAVALERRTDTEQEARAQLVFYLSFAMFAVVAFYQRPRT